MSSKITGSIASDDNLFGVGNGASVKVGNVGIQGIIPDIGYSEKDGKLAEAWVSSYPYVSQDVIPVPLKTPRFFELMPNSDEWRKAWISIFTKHATTIVGLDSTLTVETEEEEIGGLSEVISAIKDVKKARSNIVITAKEKEYKSLTKFVDYCINYGQKDYALKKPLVVNFIDSIDEIGGGYSADYFTGTVLWIESDITRLKVVDAYYSTGVFFKTGGSRTSEKNPAAGGSTKELSFDLASITLSTPKVFELAEKILPTLEHVKFTDANIVLTEEDIGAFEKALL